MTFTLWFFKVLFSPLFHLFTIFKFWFNAADWIRRYVLTWVYKIVHYYLVDKQFVQRCWNVSTFREIDNTKGPISKKLEFNYYSYSNFHVCNVETNLRYRTLIFPSQFCLMKLNINFVFSGMWNKLTDFLGSLNGNRNKGSRENTRNERYL